MHALSAGKKIITYVFGTILVMAIVLFCLIRILPDYNAFIVKSESMVPAINMGDMIITGPPGGPITDELAPGVIVTYERNDSRVTHRVLELNKEEGYITTQGDAVEDPDPWNTKLENVVGVYIFKIPWIGLIANFIRSKTGWFLVIILPAAVLVMLLVKDILKEAFSEDEKKKEATKDEEEEASSGE